MRLCVCLKCVKLYSMLPRFYFRQHLAISHCQLVITAIVKRSKRKEDREPPNLNRIVLTN